MREALHVAIEIFFISAGVWSIWAIIATLRETFGGK